MQSSRELIVSRKLCDLYSKYNIDEKPIGKGAYGWVYSGCNKTTNEKVAIKILMNFPNDSVNSKRLFREIKILHMLKNHSNVVSLQHIAASNTDDKFEGMALIFKNHDTDLDRVIRSRQVLSIEHLQFILYQILCAVAYIHSAKLVHRDLKPANILIDENCHTTICDFGLARATHAISKRSATVPRPLYRKLTEYMVTRWYRCPELILGNSNAGEAPADMWSVGCILAELLLRKPLFVRAKNNDQLIYAIIDMIGTPEPEDFEWIENQSHRSFLQKYPKQLCQIKQTFIDKNDSVIDLLKKLLHFNPAKRLTAEQALQHPFVSSYAHQTTLNFSMESMSSQDISSLKEYYVLEAESESCESINLTKRIHALIRKEILRYTCEPVSLLTPISDTTSKLQDIDLNSHGETSEKLMTSDGFFSDQSNALKSIIAKDECHSKQSENRLSNARQMSCAQDDNCSVAAYIVKEEPKDIKRRCADSSIDMPSTFFHKSSTPNDEPLRETLISEERHLLAEDKSSSDDDDLSSHCIKSFYRWALS